MVGRGKLFTYLGHEHKAEGGGGTEDDKHRDEDEGGVLAVGQDDRDGRARDAHNHYVVHAQADVLRVVEGRYGDVPRLPGQEGAKYLDRRRRRETGKTENSTLLCSGLVDGWLVWLGKSLLSVQ